MSKDTAVDAEQTTVQQLEQIVRLLISARSASLTIERVLQLLAETLGARGGAVILSDEAVKSLQGCTWGEFQHQMVQVAAELRDGMGTQATATARHTILPGMSEAPSPDGVLFAGPIHGSQQVFGIIVLFCSVQPPVELHTALAFLNTVGACLGLYLQNTGLQERLKSLDASRDTLAARRPVGYDPDRIVGDSAAIKTVLLQAEQAARSRSTVLLRGESGTGKELIARALHKLSARSECPFVKLNCAALPESLLESELFGHERGAFTGAVKMRRGRFETADKGTLFLDEIGDISPSTQVKLLRVLQERTFERVGGNRSITVDVRIIAATNADLEEAVRARRFREDLYYRLHVVPITLPPLRERQEDIPLLVGHFLQRYNAENHKSLKISSAAMDLIVGYDWPGNVRELENCIERMVVMARREILAPEEVPLPVAGPRPVVSAAGFVSDTAASSLTQSIEELERERLIEALKRSGGVQTRAATLLGITPRQLGYKVRKYSIDPKRLLIS